MDKRLPYREEGTGQESGLFMECDKNLVLGEGGKGRKMIKEAMI